MIWLKCRIKKVLGVGFRSNNVYCKWRMSCKNIDRCFDCENFYKSRYFANEYSKKIIQGFEEGFKKVTAALPQVAGAFANLSKSIQEAVKNINDTINSLYKTYPNRRVVHLAKNHKSARVRKKNQKRIEKYFKKR